MGDAKPTVVVTGISGNLGTRLLPQLGGFNVIGVDLTPPATDLPLQFERMDLGEEESCRQLFLLLRESRAEAVVHLAFVLDPVRAGVLDLDRMWQINVAGTARVMEAITEANHEETIVRKFVFPSSVSVYGSDLTGAGDRGTSAGRPYPAVRDPQDGMRQGGATAGARTARVQRVHAASAYFCRGQRAELHGRRFSGHAGGTKRPGGQHEEPGQAAALPAADGDGGIWRTGSSSCMSMTWPG